MTTRTAALILTGVAMAVATAIRPAGAAADKRPAPSCRQCGGTCGLEPICVCNPRTNKKPKVEYEVECEPICLPGCGSAWSPCRRAAERCSSCCQEPCSCPGRVRHRKQLRRHTSDEDVATIERRVEYVCHACASPTASGCCDGPEPDARADSAWWHCLLRPWAVWR